MKIHLYGNVLNNSYNLTVFLRRLGYEAILFLDDSSPNPQDYPWWEDTKLNHESLPNWIRYYKLEFNPYFNSKIQRQFLNDFSKGDIALVCGWGPIVAYKAKIPFIFYSYGDDLNLADIKFQLRTFMYKLIHFERPNGILLTTKFGIFQAFALRNYAKYILIAMGYQLNHIKNMKLNKKMIKYRLIWDVQKYNVTDSTEMLNKYSKYDLVYFMISRHNWSSKWKISKGNDKFLKAFARFYHEQKPNVKLLLVEKGWDIKRSKTLVSELRIESICEWLPEMNKDKIRDILSINNLVVIDQFWHDKWFDVYREDLKSEVLKRFLQGDKKSPSEELKNCNLSIIGFGSGSIEALCAGKPLITTFFDHQFYNGTEPPIFSAFSEEEIYNQLIKVKNLNNSEKVNLSNRCKQFVAEYHGWEKNIKIIEDLIK